MRKHALYGALIYKAYLLLSMSDLVVNIFSVILLTFAKNVYNFIASEQIFSFFAYNLIQNSLSDINIREENNSDELNTFFGGINLIKLGLLRII